MTNDEIRMTKEIRSTKSEPVRCPACIFVCSALRHSSLGHSSFFRHSSFDIRHFCWES